MAIAAVALLALGGSPLLAGGTAPPPKEPPVREIFVPFEDLNVLLEQQPRRVLLSRQEYQDLLKKAKQVPERHAPHAALLVSADYAVSIDQQRARLACTLVLDVLEDGLHAVPLDLGGVGIVDAKLDKRSAPIGRLDGGRPNVLVEGIGRHELTLDMVTPLEATAARQVLNFRVPRPPAARMRLTVPGDVEVKGGADVITRVVDAAAGVTRFELLPREGDTTLVMTLNSHLQRQQRAVLARSVLVDEVTQAYEKLHATISLAVLYRAVDEFRFAVPEGFDVTEVTSPLLARWDVKQEQGRKILTVRLREQTTETVVLSLSAVKTPSQLADWQLPRLEPLDVEGQVAVVGLLVEDRLKAQSIAAQGLIPIDTTVLAGALPPSVLSAAPGTPMVRAVAAYYAPQGTFSLSGRFDKPEAKLAVTTSLLLVLDEKSQRVYGGFALLPEAEKRFAFDFTVPPDWTVIGVTARGDVPLPFERYDAAGEDLPKGSGRIHVRLPQGMAVGAECQVNFEAVLTPPGWLDEWEEHEERSVGFPAFAVIGAGRDEGAIAVAARDDMTARPGDEPAGLAALDDNEKQKFGFPKDIPTSLAYRYETPKYNASFVVERTPSRLTARTFSFLTVKPDALVAHYEVIYNVAEARTRQVSLLLPEKTPTALSIRSLDNLRLKEYAGEVVGDERCWTVLLEDAQRGIVRLAVDFEQPLEKQEPKGLALPVVRADGVEYQSGVVAVEGSAELSVAVKTVARQVDVGELVDARHQPGRRLLGAYGFVGDPPPVKIDVARDPGYRLYPAIVERAELHTHLSAGGLSATEAQFRLRTKALYLELKLPEEAELWSVVLDGTPARPQREDDAVLVSLPVAAANAARNLQVVYALPVRSVILSGKVRVPAPKLFLRADRNAATKEEVPLSDLFWHLHVPSGYEVTRAGGTVVTDQLQRPAPAAVEVAGLLYCLAGGVQPFYGVHTAASRAVSVSVERSGSMSAADQRDVGGQTLPSSSNMNDIIEYLHGEAEGEKAAERPDMKPAEDSVDVKSPARDAQPDVKPAEPPPMAETPAPTPQPPGEAPAAKPEGGKESGYTIAKPVWETKSRRSFDLQGVRSLKIDLAEAPRQAGNVLTFRSLGVEPELVVTLANRSRFHALAWGLALAVALAGVAMTNRPVHRKAAFVVLVALMATLVPLVFESIEIARLCNGLFYAAAALVPYYLVVGLVKWLVRAIRTSSAKQWHTTGAATAILLALGMMTSAEAAPPDGRSGAPYIIQVVEPGPPVNVPEDAVILPYDPSSKEGIQKADRLLVPYAKYVDLWNRAHPDKKIDAHPAPVPYALAGATYATTLEGDEYLVVAGRMEIDVLVDGYVTIPLGLRGGVLARADLDGKPARLSTVEPVPDPFALKDAAAKAAPPGGSLGMLYVSGKGRRRLDLAVRLRLSRQGGWRVAEGVLPAATATGLAITVPEAKTEVRLGQVADRRSYETEKAGEKIQTALGVDGALSVQWRPKVAEAEVDRSLTARSAALLDVQEDGLRLTWKLNLEFRRGRREQFTVSVPPKYLVEKVEGPNVRGWELRNVEGKSTVEVTLLKPAKDQEEFTLRLWRGGAVGRKADDKADDLREFDVPLVSVADAALSNGELSIRRSPQLELRTVVTPDRAGATRADLGSEALQLAGAAGGEQSPLGIRPYQAYRFVAVPFTLRLAATAIEPEVSAFVQTVLKATGYRRRMESKVTLNVQGRPIYRAEMFLPEELKVEQVLVPGDCQWAITRADNRPLLTVYLAAGRQGEVPVVIHGTLGQPGAFKEFPATLPLPRLEVRGVQRQQGDIAVQADPGFQVDPENLNENCQRVLLDRVFPWLSADQQRLTRLALHCRQADYAGAVRLSRREPDVSCETVTNVRVTLRAVEETILLEFNVKNAGIRGLSFALPGAMQGCRISAPMLRQKTVEEQDDGLLVSLEFQDEVMGQLRVLVENDRLLARDTRFSVPIPAVKLWNTNRQYVCLETAGRDEVKIVALDKLDPLNRQQKEWQTLKGKLGLGFTQAYLVTPGAESPKLVFATVEREAIKTAGARIGLATTTLVVDQNGAYRGEQRYKLNNTTEQYLEIQLPGGAELWTARVADDPVKPTQDPQAPQGSPVRIPLLKTATGGADYDVVLRYGGKMPALGGWATAAFPLIHTVKIRPELSQVELYVPKTHRWLRFGGTMRQVKEEGDLAAGYVAYQNWKAQELLDIVRGGSEFDKVRAASNLKQIGLAVQNLQSQSKLEVAANPSFQSELTFNAAITQQAEQEVIQLEKGISIVDGTDNRARLNEFYEGQQTVNVPNSLALTGMNFSDAPTVQQQPSMSQAETFNNTWFDQNKLANPVALPQAGKARPGTTVTMGGAGTMAGTSGITLGNVNISGGTLNITAGNQPKAAEVAQGKLRSQLTTPAQDVQGQADQAGRRVVTNGGPQVARYKERLDMQQAAQQPDVTFGGNTLDGRGDAAVRTAGQPIVPGGTDRTVTMSEFGTGRAQGPAVEGLAGFDVKAMGRHPGNVVAPLTPPAPADATKSPEFGLAVPQFGGDDRKDAGAQVPATPRPPAATGLASLELELPNRDGPYEVYRFTTPRGEVELSAWAASNEWLTSLTYFAVTAAVVLLGFLVVWIGRRAGLAWLGGSYGSTLLIVLGLAALVCGIFWVVALAALVAGIAVKIRRAAAASGRREQPVAAEVIGG